MSYHRARRMQPAGIRPGDIPARPAGIFAVVRRHLSAAGTWGLLGVVLILAFFTATFYLATRPDSSADIPLRLEPRPGFRSVPVTEGLSLQETARNWKYYQIMTSVCHRAGHERIAAAYAYLFYSANRYSLSGKWSGEQFDAAVDAVQPYYDIDPAVDCTPDAQNLHGLDVDADLWLMTRALNYVFYSHKVPVCEAAGNKVQARSYAYLADSEHAKLMNRKWSGIQVNAAIAGARESPDLHRITGC